MVVRIVASFVLIALMLSGGRASAAPRYSDWHDVTYFAVANTAELEFANAISKDGLTFYFQRGDSTVNGEDIWIVQRANSDAPWDTPTKLPDTVNSAFNERAAFESPDGHSLYFASNRSGGKGDFDLYVSSRQYTHDALGWGPPRRLDELNTAGFDSGPAGFEDELAGAFHLYFVSGPQNPAVDIYESLQNSDGSFGAPTKVNELNSPVNEGRPWVRHDGLEIFFHSARAGGPGAPDIWVATRDSVAAPWSTPQQARGVNTSAIDITPVLSWDGRTLFFSSSRSGSNGELYFATRDKVTGKP